MPGVYPHLLKYLEHFLYILSLQRAISVIYCPEIESLSPYYFMRLAYQFDRMIHIDETIAVEPLDFNLAWKK